MTRNACKQSINVNKLELELINHPDRQFVNYLITGLRQGFDNIVFQFNLPTMECKNLLSARNDPDTVDTLVAQEVERGYLRGPLPKLPFESYRVSPIGIAEGKYSGKKRLILDWSSPHDNDSHPSINNLIDKDLCSLNYVKLDDAIKAIIKCGKNALLNKTDIVDAFKTNKY